MTIQQKIRMTVEDYLVWAVAQPGRYELVDGEPLAMASERARHNKVKYRICRALDDAIECAGLPCEVFTDGMTVVIDPHTAREPDASVQCGLTQDLDSMVLPAPLIVVEVVSPSNPKMDTTTKLVEYFKVPSIQHYLILQPDQRAAIHHRRAGEGIETRIVTAGDVRFDPPGFSLTVDGLWPETPP